MPFRLHTPVPTLDQREPPDPSKLVTVADNLNYRMCSLMFFSPYVVERLADVDYGFFDADLRQANAEFPSMLAATEASILNDDIPLYVPLRQIASSVQF